MDNDTTFGSDRWEALGRYVAGEAEPAEAAAIARWLADHPADRDLVQALERRIAGAAALPANLDVEAALTRVTARLDEVPARPLPSGEGRWAAAMGWARDWGLLSLPTAAALVLALGGGAFVWHEMARRFTPSVAFGTPIGRVEQVRLSDGSEVTLGPRSRLVAQAGYGVAGRDVDLTGEALFNVKHDPRHPFRVRIGTALIEDIGTTFVVRGIGDEVQVTVTAGSVALRDTATLHQGTGVVLKAGDRGRVARSGATTAQRHVDTAEALAWTRGRLVFDNAPLDQVRADLRRWYGLVLAVGDSALADRHVTASFEHEGRSQVVHIIALTLGAVVEEHGDTAVLRAGSGAAGRR